MNTQLFKVNGVAFFQTKPIFYLDGYDLERLKDLVRPIRTKVPATGAPLVDRRVSEETIRIALKKEPLAFYMNGTIRHQSVVGVEIYPEGALAYDCTDGVELPKASELYPEQRKALKDWLTDCPVEKPLSDLRSSIRTKCAYIAMEGDVDYVDTICDVCRDGKVSVLAIFDGKHGQAFAVFRAYKD